jgi:hypothetical protein
VNNLWEYASGGNPTNVLLRGTQPRLSRAGQENGVNWIEYIHLVRTNDESLIYTIECVPDLTKSSWTKSSDAVVIGIGSAPDSDFQTVTNRIPTVGKTNEFLRLRIEQ